MCSSRAELQTWVKMNRHFCYSLSWFNIKNGWTIILILDYLLFITICMSYIADLDICRNTVTKLNIRTRMLFSFNFFFFFSMRLREM